MTTKSDPFASAMGKYMMRLKYEKLEQKTIVIDNDQENDTNGISTLAEINLKLIKLRAVSNIKPKIVSTIVYLHKLRDAYVQAMHRFAEHVIQLNNGSDAFKKVTCSP